jgi:hypothetical protein
VTPHEDARGRQWLLPSWAGYVFLAMGIAVLASAFDRGSPREARVMAGLVAAMFLFVGLARGVPLRSPQQGLSQPEAWAALRRRYWAVQASGPLWMGLAWLVVALTADQVRLAAVVLTMSLPVAALFWLVMSACPSCGRHFFIGGLRLSLPWKPICQHCGAGF